MPRAFEHASPVTSADQFEAWLGAEPKCEARCLVQLLGKAGNTVETLRELIRVAPEEEAILRGFAHECPELAEQIEGALRYRIQVEQEFESLVSRNTEGGFHAA